MTDESFIRYLPQDAARQLELYEQQVIPYVQPEDKALATLRSDLFKTELISATEIAFFAGIGLHEVNLAMANMQKERKVWRYEMTDADILERRFAAGRLGAQLLIARYAISRHETIVRVRETIHHHTAHKDQYYKAV